MKPLSLCLSALILLVSQVLAASPDFGPNVFIFDPSTPTQEIQRKMDQIHDSQFLNQFGPERYAFLFKPGTYSGDYRVAFYMHLAGLGKSPSEVVIDGNVRTLAWENNRNVTQNFWRAIENMTVQPKEQTVTWAVSQAVPMRRMHFTSNLALSFAPGWASGGYMADCKIDGKVIPGSQQQWFSRNSAWGNWTNGVWNMVFMGVENAPAGTWPLKPYTTMDTVPVIAEKPYLYVDKGGAFFVMVPGIKTNSKGVDWTAEEQGKSLPITDFYIAKSTIDNAASINAALASGKHLILTPGVYQLDAPIKVERPNTIVLGLGMATLQPVKGTSAMEVSDVDGVKIAGILFDAGAQNSPSLLQVGELGSTKDHSTNPTFLYDIFCRVGGNGEANVTSAMILNSNDVIGDHSWIWRADHGKGAGWTSNKSKNGLIVNGKNTIFYALFVEHFQEYQTLWNGDNGKLYFYQSEIPYDVPSTEAWSHDGVKGWAAYKIADNVKKHEATGLGIYSYFRDGPVTMDNAAEAPKAAGIKFTNIMTFWLTGNDASAINSVISGIGEPATKTNRWVRVTSYPPAL
ncbi:MAG: hypothetical protein WCO94_09780 [Verrucomicrobiota bacterium]